MKKFIFAAFVLLIGFHSFAWNGPDVQKLLEQSFEQSFPNAEHVTWSNDADGYTVCFTVKSILTRISYDKKGNFTSSLRNYTGQMLPFFITNLLKQRYPKDQIYGVTEITSPAALNYFVKLESAKNWITVQVDNEGNSMVVEKYRKQK
ncbi:MAG TPA: hypothetical protein VGS79_29690 [Puia sp.]|nr:hypothetical protein [Puia sp.]